MGNQIFYSSWHRKGATKIHYLLNERGNFFIDTRYGLSVVNFLTYNGILAAIPNVWKKSFLISEPLNNSKEHNLTSANLMAKTARKMFVLKMLN